MKDANFEENFDIACALAKMMNSGKSFSDMMAARDVMQNDLKDKVLKRVQSSKSG